MEEVIQSTKFKKYKSHATYSGKTKSWNTNAPFEIVLQDRVQFKQGIASEI